MSVDHWLATGFLCLALILVEKGPFVLPMITGGPPDSLAIEYIPEFPVTRAPGQREPIERPSPTGERRNAAARR